MLDQKVTRFNMNKKQKTSELGFSNEYTFYVMLWMKFVPQEKKVLILKNQ